MISALAVSRPEVSSWFPDWRDCPCAIVASGPSLKSARIDALRGHFRVIAIKEVAVDKAPWADAVYGCDAAWWVHRNGLPKFSGLKIAWEDSVGSRFPDVRLIKIRETKRSTRSRPEYDNRILVDEPGVVGAGHNSGFQAINLAVQFGSRRIALIGFDAQGEHYYGRNNWLKAGNPDAHQHDRSRKMFEANAALLKSLGVDVVNVSPVSTINCFRRSTLEQVISDWCS